MSTARRPAVIVDPYSSGALFAPAFQQAGVPVLALVSSPVPPQVYAASFRPQDYPEVITHHGDLAQTQRRLRELDPLCVLPGCESGVELADRLTAAVLPELANVPELTDARRHKGAMAEAVARAGLPTIPQICTDDPGRVAAWIAESGLAGRDLVVKPPKSAGTDGVTKVPGGRGWQQVFEGQIGRPNRLGLVNEQLLVQEYAVGTEYVVDLFSHGGEHTVADVCRYGKVDNGVHMAVYESLVWLAPEDPVVPVVTAYAKQVLDAVGLRYGTAHVELMLTADGPRLIEVGVRPHGGGHPRYCRAATGDSQVDRAVRYFTGQGEIPGDYQLRRHVRVAFLMSRTAGVVRSAASLSAIGELASHFESVINVRAGDRIGVTEDLFATFDLGFVVLAHPDREQVLADEAAVRRAEAGLEVLAEAVPT
ncbi:ATP-grasp domain-containing protein [Kutzneria albida]|uniref:ATP-binding protein n=1 Tax=Kutzneria albida DSM 43870 TaxID=1449976 RepID=W5W4C9_9PSEU|nr:ATP-grasp domain-containing protein [Kutzneria albida]AHH96098.1 ATP-binding protein [Kutzneria albida DSM 43870]